MDIFKVLSRGTKKSASHPAVPKPVAAPVTPQLYNDPTRGTKRKRNTQALPDADHDSDSANDIDFFAPKDAAAKSKSSKPAPQPTKAAAPVPEPLDDDEARQILRSHRLKFTLLSSREDPAKSSKKDKKDKKKRKKNDVKEKSKDGKLPLHPQPLVSFAELRTTYAISTRLTDNLAKQGYRIPTEVQLGSLPLLLDPKRALPTASSEGIDLGDGSGVDFLAVAPTGSGKTLSFLIPTINRVLRRRADAGDNKDHALDTIVIAPTRELAHQIANEGKKLAQGTGVKIVAMKKGMRIPTERQESGPESDNEDASGSDASGSSSEEEQGEDAEDGKGAKPVTKADVLVTTPLMLLNMLKKGANAGTLPTVKSLVLDEADVLLDPLFRDQTMGIWDRCTNPALRLTCWSATMGSNIEQLVLEQLKPRTAAPLVRLVVGLKDTAVPSINHKLIYTATEQGKLFALRQLLHPTSSSSTVPDMKLPFLIFTQTIERATALHSELKFDIAVEAGGSSRIAALHSSMSETARSAIIARFRAGEIWVLITTDLLMRGIDFRGVNGVINYDVPTSTAAYVHRVGRTGRAGHRGGVAVTLYTTEDVPHLKSIANVISLSEKQAGKPDGEGVPRWLMDALPKIGKDEKKKLRTHGVESRRGNKTKITSKSAWERRKENNRRGAIEGSKNRKTNAAGSGDESGGESAWGGLED